ncbi:MAG: DUF167 family protein [Gammaproteobacteria bacterium]
MFYRWLDDDLVLTCRIQPRARQDGFAEISQDAVKILITAPPVDGKANQHLIKFLSRQFKTPQSNIQIEQGAAGRSKRIRICAPKRLPPELQIIDRYPDA